MAPTGVISSSGPPSCLTATPSCSSKIWQAKRLAGPSALHRPPSHGNINKACLRSSASLNSSDLVYGRRRRSSFGLEGRRPSSRYLLSASVEGSFAVKEASSSPTEVIPGTSEEEKSTEEPASSVALAEGATPAESGQAFRKAERFKPRVPGQKARREDPAVPNEALVPGATFTGTVTTIQPFGAFVNFGAFTDGLVHISKLSKGYVSKISDFVKLGQEVKVTILNVEETSGRIALTMVEEGEAKDAGAKTGDSKEGGERVTSRLQQGPDGRPINRGRIAGGGRQSNRRDEPRKAATKLVKGQEVEGTVKNKIRSGVFVDLPDNEEAFLRFQDVPGGDNMAQESSLQIGQKIKATVLRIDRGKISLTMKPVVDITSLNRSINKGDDVGAANPFEIAFRALNMIPKVEDEADQEDKTGQLSGDIDTALAQPPPAEALTDELETGEEVAPEATISALEEGATESDTSLEGEAPTQEDSPVNEEKSSSKNAIESETSDVSSVQDVVSKATDTAVKVEEEATQAASNVSDESPLPSPKDDIPEIPGPAEAAEAVKEAVPDAGAAVDEISSSAEEAFLEMKAGQPSTSPPLDIISDVPSFGDASKALKEAVPDAGAAANEVSSTVDVEVSEAKTELKLQPNQQDIVSNTGIPRPAEAAGAVKVASPDVPDVSEPAEAAEAVKEALLDTPDAPDFPEPAEATEKVKEAVPDIPGIPKPAEAAEAVEEAVLEAGAAVNEISSSVSEMLPETEPTPTPEAIVPEVPGPADAAEVVNEVVLQANAAVDQISSAIEENLQVTSDSGNGKAEGPSSESESPLKKESLVESSTPEAAPVAPQAEKSEEKAKATGPSAAVVKQLREETGAGMMDCKKALVETTGDIEKARDYLRKKGLASADKKASRIAAEGLVGSYVHDSRVGVLVEVNCETDFVARGPAFKSLVQDVGMQVVASGHVQYVSVDDVAPEFVDKEKEVEAQREDLASKPEGIRAKIVDGRVSKRISELSLLEQPYIRDDKILVKDMVKQSVATLGENIKIRRFERYVLGEGLAKKGQDFAAEVAAQTAAVSNKTESCPPPEPESASPAPPPPKPEATSTVPVSASLVKELREQTGAGMMDCKKALAAAENDLEKATDYLRKKGLAGAEKKAGRVASEGLIGTYIHDGRIGVMIEVNCETDFVARGQAFKDLVQDMAMQVAAYPHVQYVNVSDVSGDFVAQEKEIESGKEDLASKPEAIRAKIVEGRVTKRLAEMALTEQPYIRDDKKMVKDLVNETIATLGENIQIRRFARFNLGEGLAKKNVDFASEVASQTSVAAS